MGVVEPTFANHRKTHPIIDMPSHHPTSITPRLRLSERLIAAGKRAEERERLARKRAAVVRLSKAKAANTKAGLCLFLSESEDESEDGC